MKLRLTTNQVSGQLECFVLKNTPLVDFEQRRIENLEIKADLKKIFPNCIEIIVVWKRVQNFSSKTNLHSHGKSNRSRNGIA